MRITCYSIDCSRRISQLNQCRSYDVSNVADEIDPYVLLA